MTTIADTLRLAAGTLTRHSDSSSPRLDAQILLSNVLGIGRSVLIARGDEGIASDALELYRELISRRVTGAPIAYLTGTREFWSLALKVTPAVLVPRPETEKLVELALQLLPQKAVRSVLDLGTGSGAIALAIASERPCARVTGVDISQAALAVAKENSLALALPQVAWRLGSWFEAVADERFDLVVANPPYVAAGDRALEALAAEPALALTSGPTGLESLRVIIGAAASHLTPAGRLLVEHGSEQGREVALLFERNGFRGIQSHVDYSGLPRVTQGTIHSANQEP